MYQLLLTIGLSVLLYMTAWYVFSLILRDASIVDVAWGPGFVLIAIISMFKTAVTPVLILLTALILLWALRLSMHIVMRKLKKPGEDFRYAKWRKDWGSSFVWRSYVQVFLLQGVIMILIALPIVWVAYERITTIDTFVVGGTALWLCGFMFESIADSQLTQFKKRSENKGKLLTKGLWKFSRHPNYFGEAVQWWGVWVIALSSPAGWWTVVSPLLITYFLRFVSGVPMLEKKYEGTPAFEAYKKRTNAFVPWLPRSS